MIRGENFLEDLGDGMYIVWKVVDMKLRVGTAHSLVICKIIATDFQPVAGDGVAETVFEYPLFRSKMVPVSTTWSFPSAYQKT